MSYKKAYIETYVEAYIDEMVMVMKKNLNHVLESGAIDIEKFDPKNLRIGLPKTIAHTLATYYLEAITPTEKQFSEHQTTIKNIRRDLK